MVIECHLKSEASAFEEFAFSKRIKKGTREKYFLHFVILLVGYTCFFSCWAGIIGQSSIRIPNRLPFDLYSRNCE